MATVIAPQKALNNTDSMHYYLKQKLLSSTSIRDLIPFLKFLIGIDELKKQLLCLLDVQKQIETSTHITTTTLRQHEDKSKIRPLFLSTFSMNGIPSDHIHAHILSFLPSKEYTKIPILSKHFRNVMIRNQAIFNEKDYEIKLKFESKNYYKYGKTEVNVWHHHKQMAIDSAYDVNDEQLCKYHEKPNYIIQLNKIKHWQLYNGSGREEKYEKVSHPFEDAHNITLRNILFKHNNNIEILEVCIGDEGDKIFSNLFKIKDSFNRVKVLQIHLDMLKNPLIPHQTSFKNIQHLQISFGAHFRQDLNAKFDEWSNIMVHTKSLKSLIITRRTRGSWFAKTFDDDKVMRLPANIEWISMCKFGFTLDMTDCDKLIGVRLMGVDQNRILWPKKKVRMIPLVSLGDADRDDVNDYWKNMVLDKKINCNFVILQRCENRYGRHCSRWCGIKWNDDKDIKDTVYIDNILKHKQSEKCMILAKKETDFDLETSLFDKIMKFAFKDQQVRQLKFQLSRKWIKLVQKVYLAEREEG